MAADGEVRMGERERKQQQNGRREREAIWHFGLISWAGEEEEIDGGGEDGQVGVF